MAWTIPLTWIPRQLVNAGNMNTHVRDNLLALSEPPNTFVEITADQTTMSNSYVDLPGATGNITPERNGNIIAMFKGDFSNSSFGFLELRFDLDGSPTNTLIRRGLTVTSNMFIIYRWTGLDLSSHTIKVQWRISAATCTYEAATATSTLQLMELA